MAKKNIFEQVFSPIGQAIRGTARGIFPGAARAADIETKGQKVATARIQSLIDSDAGRRLVDKARASALDRGEGYYGGSKGGADPRYDQIKTLISALDSTTDEKVEKSITSELQFLFGDIKEERNRRKKEDKKAKLGFSPEGADPVDIGVRMGGGLKSLPRADTAADFIGPPAPAELRADFIGPPSPADYLTDDFTGPPAPRTYQQLGITGVDDMATLGEMQKALPDRDMRQEYETDPESMQRLMRLWKEKKVNKANLHKFFSIMQQKAQQALGVA